MKFKVGDRVRLVRVEDENVSYEKYLKKEFEIEAIYNSFNPHCKLKGINEIAPYLKNLELVKEYTYEDLKKTPIGTKIKFENGETLLKDGAGLFESDGYVRTIEELKKFETRLLGKIVKIEEPTYSTVYEYKPEILDEAEKRYLRGVIRPFRNNVEIIRRMYSRTKNKDYIQIRYKNDTPTNLPYFEKDTMYKGMELDKIYTLEELGL